MKQVDQRLSIFQTLLNQPQPMPSGLPTVVFSLDQGQVKISNLDPAPESTLYPLYLGWGCDGSATGQKWVIVSVSGARFICKLSKVGICTLKNIEKTYPTRSIGKNVHKSTRLYAFSLPFLRAPMSLASETTWRQHQSLKHISAQIEGV